MDLEQQQQQQQRSTSAGPNQQKGAPVAWQLEQKYTLNQVQAHSSLDDCWMVIFDKVYDITNFVYEHPGGDFILLEYAGRDATHPFLSSRHGSLAYKMLDKYWIGILVDEELYYSNNSSYCSVYSSLSWRSTPTLEQAELEAEVAADGPQQQQQQPEEQDAISADAPLATGEGDRLASAQSGAAAAKEPCRREANLLYLPSEP